jgi:hypothetical protein
MQVKMVKIIPATVVVVAAGVVGGPRAMAAQLVMAILEHWQELLDSGLHLIKIQMELILVEITISTLQVE